MVNALVVALGSVAAFVVAYLFYGRFLSDKIFRLDPTRTTPAHTFRDGVDYVPTKRIVLFGHHFVSIAGLGPIMGPAIAVIWGWLPALLWVVLGTIFLGAVHDLGALAVSLRHQGRSIGDLTRDIIGNRARILFLLIVFFLLAMAMGVFALVIATLFSEAFYPEAVVPFFLLILTAALIGTLVYRYNVPLGPATLLGLVLMLLGIWVGLKFPVTGVSMTTWIYMLLAYAFVASVLPVWILLQPRDYLNSYKLYIGLAFTFAGLLIYHPPIVAPAVNRAATDLPPIFPFLFITIACGAISGFHSVVSSGTTVRQLENEGDARAIGFGAMLTEGALATVVIVACTAGVASTEAWHEHYKGWTAASGLGPQLSAFIDGAGVFISHTGVPLDWAKAFIAVVVVAFAMTTLDSATRLLRYNVEELGKSAGLGGLSNRYLAALVAVAAIGYFALMKMDGKPAGLTLWQLFGTTNQVLAGLGLLTVSAFLYKTRVPVVYTLMPMAFMMVMTISAMLLKLRDFYAERSWPLIVVGAAILGMAVWLCVEAVIAYRGWSRHRPETEVAAQPTGGIS